MRGMSAVQIKVRDFRGVEDFEAVLSDRLIVAGENASGKSSVCKSVGAALSGMLLPFDGVTKGTASLIVRDGGSEASVVLRDDDGSVAVRWPDCERAEKGKAPAADPVVAGLVDPLRMKADERAAWLIGALGASPSEETTRKALGEKHLHSTDIDTVWRDIDERGWDSASQRVREDALKLKGQWEKITGTKYGRNKGASWRPEGWASSMDKGSLPDLKEKADALAAKVEENRKAALVAEARRRDWEAQILRRQEAFKAKPEAEALVAECRAALEAAQGARDKLGVAAGRALTCPCCNRPLILVRGQLERLPQNAGDPDKIADADEALLEAKRALDRAEAKVSRLAAEIAAGDKAQEEIAALPPTLNPEELADLRRRAGEAQTAWDMLRRKEEAEQLHFRIDVWAEVYVLLGEKGLRRTALLDALAAFCDAANARADRAKWEHIAINEDMTIEYAGRPVSLASESEMWRARALIILTAAEKMGAAAAILDGADILDPAGRNGLMRACGPTPVMIGMTVRKEEVSEKLVASGRIVWVEKRAT